MMQSMNDVPKIDSKESLAAWLEEEALEIALLLSYRAAMRVVPVWSREMSVNLRLKFSLKSPTDNYLEAVLAFRAVLTAGAALKYQESNLNDAAYDATGTIFQVVQNERESLGTYRRSAIQATASAVEAVATSQYDEIIASADAVEAVDQAIKALAFPMIDNNRVMGVDLWPLVEIDAYHLRGGKDLLETSIWPSENPVLEFWQSSSSFLDNLPGGSFWIDWYQRALDGRPQNWDLLRDVACIDDTLWREGGERLDRAIRDIQATYQLDRIIAENPYAWRIILDRKSGLFEAEPSVPRDLDDIVKAVRSDIRDFNQRCKKFGVSNFGEAVKHAFAPPIDILKRDLKRYRNAPLSLYKALGAARREMEQIATVEGYAGESYLLRFFDALASAAEDICLASPEIVEQIKRRQELRYELMTVESRLQICRQIVGLHLDAEGMLKRAALQALLVINDPMAKETDKKEAWYFAQAVLPRAARAFVGLSEDEEVSLREKGDPLVERLARLDLSRFRSGQVLMLSGPLFEGHG